MATVDIAGRSISLERATVHIGEKQSAEVEGSYDLDEPGSLDLKITTRGLNVAAMRSFGLGAIQDLPADTVGLVMCAVGSTSMRGRVCIDGSTADSPCSDWRRSRTGTS